MPKPDPGPDFWRLIEPHTGPVSAVHHTARGFTTDVTAIVETGAGRVFVKAGRDPGPHVTSLEREAAINPHVRALSPALLWQQRGGGWYVLGFGVVDGRHADITPGSADLPAVADAVAALGKLPCPEVTRDWPETRWNRFSDRPGLLAGEQLLHGDINPGNLLVRSDGQITVVDWAWPTRGAAFIDPACLVVQLIAAGHSPADAEGWAARCPAWSAADPAAIDAFATATVAMYQHFEERDPAPWRNAMTAAVTSWADHRSQQWAS
jgi:hypothetical protein